jgi:transglutaminase-like putative cysteine protease
VELRCSSARALRPRPCARFASSTPSWADFYLDGAGWIPVDASEAWKHPERRDYYFGHHDADRVALSTGRDIRFPGMNGPPINFFVYPYAEKNGKPSPSDGSRR